MKHLFESALSVGAFPLLLALRGAGIAEARMSLSSYGKERPIDEGHDEAAWAENRRAHPVGR